MVYLISHFSRVKRCNNHVDRRHVSEKGVPMPFKVRYECQRCTNCCRWPGVVKVEPDEIEAIAAYVGMEEQAFIDQHTRIRPDRRGLSLLEREDRSCAWLEGADCKLQAVKPRQCRSFPNDWNFPGWREKCEAKPVLVRD